jgi:glutathionyl-hydroquinone reductase
MAGFFIDGVWQSTAGWVAKDGRFHRQTSSFRERISREAGARFPAEAGRYHVYVSYACPWAHRVMIVRSLRGLEHALGMSIVDPLMGDDGWAFTGSPGSTLDQANGAGFLREIYKKAKDDFSGRVTVPVLWDAARGTIVSNESREIIRMLDVELDDLARGGPSLAPPELVPEIDRALDAIYEPINNGVYRAGFATTQEAYEQACLALFQALDTWEQILGARRYLCGERMTEADVAMFTTLVRFDLVYFSHFKCNVRRIADYPNLQGFLREMYQTPGVAGTCNLDHIKRHYYWSQNNVNPSRVVPLGPALELDVPHDRGRFPEYAGADGRGQ